MQSDENTTPLPFEAGNEANSESTATFFLTGLRLDGRRDRPDFFTFLIEQDGQMQPLIADGQVVLFADISLAQTALKLANIQAEFKELSLRNVYLIDISQTLFLLQSQSADERKIIANTLDLFARILTALGVGVPPVFADALIEFGSYVDQNQFYGDFIEQKNITRHRLIDAVRWCLGTVMSLARIITVVGDGIF